MAYAEFMIGVIIGMFLLVPFNKIQIDYLSEHPDILEKLQNKKAEAPVTNIVTEEATGIVSQESLEE